MVEDAFTVDGITERQSERADVVVAVAVATRTPSECQPTSTSNLVPPHYTHKFQKTK